MFIYFFEKRLIGLLLLLSLPLLFLPKYNLISLSSTETAGIRIDDFILFALATLFVWAYFILNKQSHQAERWIFLLTVFSLFSFLVNYIFVSFHILHIHARIFYALRIVEYFVFFYIGILASRFFIGDRVIGLFFLWNYLLMTLQKLNIAGAITAYGYDADVAGRVQGVASFPSEMGLLLNLMFCYLIYSDYSFKWMQLFPPTTRQLLRKLYLPFVFLIFGAFVVFTGNRISILALLICFLFKLKNEFNWRSMTSLIGLGVFSILLVGGLTLILINTASVYYRSVDLFSWKNFDLVKLVWTTIDLNADLFDYEYEISSDGYDMSWWLRIHKWIYALKMFALHPECYLQGLGPGCVGAALDGGLLRILTEYGIIGALIFWRFFSSLYHVNDQIKWMTIAFAINMIFFDAHLAYKVMSFLLFCAGYHTGCQKRSVSIPESEQRVYAN